METGNEYLDSLKQQLVDYQEKEKKTASRSGAQTREQILAKYFVPRNEKETFRILPPLNPKEKPIQEAFFHVVSLNAKGGKKMHGKVIYCPAHNDPMVQKLDENGQPITEQDGKPVLVPAPCPLCEKAKAILATQDQSIRGKKKDDLTEAEGKIWESNRDIFKRANQWEAKKFYIVRGIDKGKQKDGVKFWRFKKNFKNQGTLDKLLPALNQYMEVYGKSFFDPDAGADLSITMVQSEFNNRPYMSISAIIGKPPSKLHDDPIIARQWLDDKTTWRDVFKPKSAPVITPLEYLEMVAEGNDPYWDDTDQNNKKWVYPGRPDLEEKANQRFANLDADDDNYSNFEQASDISDDGVTIKNVTKADVGTFENKSVPQAVEVGGDLEEQNDEETTTTATVESSSSDDYNEPDEDSTDGGDDYDDLPF